jgi:hypothetical protein
MKKLLPIVILMLMVPSIGHSQGNVLQVSTLMGKVEFRLAADKSFQSLTPATRTVKVGDEIKTGPGASLVLTLPDSSYMTVSENSDVVIKDSWSGGFHDIVNVLLGHVRVFIERVGGNPNNSRVTTPTALIAVRGTIFDIQVDEHQFTEVWCLQGQVSVENPKVADRQVILNPGFHTGVSDGLAPSRPVEKAEELTPSRTIYVVKKGPESEKGIDPKEMEQLIRDNDRSNRPTDRYKAPASSNGTDGNVGRAKMSFPE